MAKVIFEKNPKSEGEGNSFPKNSFSENVARASVAVLNTIIGTGKNNPDLQAERGKITYHLDGIDAQGNGIIPITSFGQTTLVELKTVVGEGKNPSTEVVFSIKTGERTLYSFGRCICKSFEEIDPEYLEMMFDTANKLNFCKHIAVNALDVNEDIVDPFTIDGNKILLTSGKYGVTGIEGLLHNLKVPNPVSRFVRRAKTPVTLIKTWNLNQFSNFTPFQFCDVLNARWNEYKIQARRNGDGNNPFESH